MIVKITGRLRDRNRCTGRVEVEVEEFVELKVYRVGSNSRCIG